VADPADETGYLRVFLHVAVWAAVLPFGMNTAGWFCAGRPPALDRAGHHADQERDRRPSAPPRCGSSLIAFIVLYGTLATVDLLLMLRYSREQLPPRAGPTRTRRSAVCI
jgi:cytochrome d ubiquinol oxidase subunit I